MTREEAAAVLHEGHRVRYRVTVMVVVLAALIVGVATYFEHQRRRECHTAEVVLERSERLDRRLFTRLGERLNASQDEIDEFLVVIHQEYEAMPKPAPC